MNRVFDPITLRLFVAVCEEGNIARAAEREAIVASAISKRIAAIEGQIGVSLLVRNRRGIAPTAAGEALLRQARGVLGTMERMHAELSEFAGGLLGSVRVFASLSVLSEHLPDDIGAFLAERNRVRVTLEERVSSDIVRGVREGAADLGVCWEAGDLAGLSTVPYRADHLVVLMPASHPLARRRRLRFVETLAFDQVEIQPGSIVQETLRREAALAGQALRGRIQVSTFDAAGRSVAAGLGIAILPNEVIGAYASVHDLKPVPLDDAWAVRRFVICMRSGGTLGAAARSLVDFLHRRARSRVAGRGAA